MMYHKHIHTFFIDIPEKTVSASESSSQQSEAHLNCSRVLSYISDQMSSRDYYRW